MGRTEIRMKAERFVLIGPVYPYKGGIAHYTGLMCRNMQEKYDVSMISYKLQYPKMLFKKEQRDYQNDAFKIEDTQYLINTANPLNWGRSVKAICALRPDLAVIQWWHPYFAPCYRSIVKKLRKKNIKVMFVCHNVFPHERFPLDKKLTRAVLKSGDYFIVHSQSDAQDLISIRSDAKYRVSIMPTFNAFRFQNLTKEAARQQLGLNADEKVLLFFGFVREYKGLAYLIAALPLIVREFNLVRLLVVGDFGDNKAQYERLIREEDMEKHVSVYDGYIPDREVEKFFAAADLSILPYISATQSAVAQLSYSFEKPVVVTSVGGLPEVVEDGRTGYIVPPKDAAAIAEAVIRFYQENRLNDFQENVRKEFYRYSWDRLREMVEELADL